MGGSVPYTGMGAGFAGWEAWPNARLVPANMAATDPRIPFLMDTPDLVIEGHVGGREPGTPWDEVRTVPWAVVGGGLPSGAWSQGSRSYGNRCGRSLGTFPGRRRYGSLGHASSKDIGSVRDGIKSGRSASDKSWGTILPDVPFLRGERAGAMRPRWSGGSAAPLL